MLGTPGRAATTGVPSIVAFASQTWAAENAGIIVHERHISVAASAGPAHFSQDNDAMLVMSDGAYRHIHFMRIVENGRQLSNDKVAKAEDDDNRKLENGEGFFKQPYDRRYLADYSYDVDNLCSCSSGDVGIMFTSTMHDDQHGSGEMVIDPVTGHVLSLTYAPFVLPDHANTGSVTETFGQALPGLWTVTHIDRTYSGRVFLVSGHGTVSEALDHFRRFNDAEAALAYTRTAAL